MSVDPAVLGLLERYARDLTRHQPVPGGVVVVVEADAPVTTMTFGVRGPTTAEPVQITDLFQIGSITKSFTSLLVLQLADEGRLDLDDPVVRWLPWAELGPWTSAVTLRHLLSHTGGLVMGGEGLPDPGALVWTLRERASFAPGQEFHYSNHGYLLLGLVVEAVEGARLADSLRRRVFEPLGVVDHALGRVAHDDRHRFATGSTPAADDRPWVPGDPLVPAPWTQMDGADGAVALDAIGLGRYLRLLLGDGTVDGRRVVSPEAMAALGIPTAPGGEDTLEAMSAQVTASRYALGLNAETVAGRPCLTHGGGNLGYASFVLADLGQDVGVGVLTNADGDCRAAELLARVAHALLTAPDDARPDYGQLPRADLRVRTGDLGPTLLGSFVGAGGMRMELTESADGVVLSSAGRQARLWATLGARYVTDHPALRAFALDPRGDDDGWTWGGEVLRRVPAPTIAPSAELAAYVGHYRSWTPWFPTLRIVEREGGLVLTAPRGVEAPGEDQPLVQVGPGQWRIGGAPWLPERVVELARVDGQVVLLDRDGARYSRTCAP